MLFTSIEFVCFFIFYWLVMNSIARSLWAMGISVLSLVFYAWWNPILVLVPIYLIIVGIFFSKLISMEKSRIIPLLVGGLMLFAPLVFFKYSKFLFENLSVLVSLPLDFSSFPTEIPIGISFITFSLYSMLHDTKSGKFDFAAYRFDQISAYVLIFPQLIAGPIIRPNELVPQIKEGKKKIIISKGSIFLFMVGVIKKILIADPIGVFVDASFSNYSNLSSFDLMLMIYAFSLQIYFDFSAYADMAIALGLMLGFKFPDNFDSPYTALSLVDFWRRWHITLSRWLRDYLYIPLGGNQCSNHRKYSNIVITMLLGGLWHGANWTFVVWGILHGVLISFTHLFIDTVTKRNSSTKEYSPVVQFLSMFVTFNLVSILWVFFRAPDLNIALDIFKYIYTDFRYAFLTILSAVPCYGIFVRIHKLDKTQLLLKVGSGLSYHFLLPLVISMLLLAITLGVTSSAKFIYFDF
jgi:alginate O-acetyltransferase complex protein AlgI